MKTTFAVVAALAHISAAQVINFNQILAAPPPSVTGPPVGVASQSQVSTVNSAFVEKSISATAVATTASVTGAQASAAATEAPSNEKRAACEVQPAGTGPHVEPDTVDAFHNFPYFQAEAKFAPTPLKYAQVFQNLKASVNSNSYLTYKVLDNYNTSDCAAFCDSVNLCTAFNIFVERDPSVEPAAACPNPPSISNYKCSLFGSSIDTSEAVNDGQYRQDFHVVIAASNGYDRSNNTIPEIIPGYQPPVNLGGASISAGGDFSVGSNFFPGPFNPALCNIYAKTQNSKNKDAAVAKGAKAFTPVNQFNAYYVKKNGRAQGTYCSLYDTPLSPAWATFSGAYSGNDYFEVETSFTFSLSTQQSGEI